MFSAARLKLTAWYLVILTIITGLFSLVVFRYSLAEFRRGLSAQSRRFLIPPILQDEIMAEISRSIALRLLLINSVILAVSGLAAYFLAGETLSPLENSLEAQKRFVADASHELKTPLAAIKTEIEVYLRDKKLDLPQAKQLLASNLEEVDKLQAFTDHLLSLSRYEAQGQKLAKQLLDLADAADAALSRLQRRLAAKHLQVTTHITPVTITANYAALTELFSILLDNSLKYTPSGGQIGLTVKKVGRRGLIEVTDTGIGIAKSDLPHIFDRFFRSESSRSKTLAGGYGLGLSIAKSIVEAHSGHITVDSHPGHTSFIVSLPL